METLIVAAVRARGGYCRRADLIEMGLADKHITLALRRELLKRIRHGTYMLAADHAAMTPEARHRMLAFSVIDRLGDGHVLFHVSGHIVHTGASFGADLEIVHVTTRNGRHGRREAGVVYHVGTVRDDDIEVVDGRPVLSAARCAMETACEGSLDAGVVALSSVMRVAGVRRDELERAHSALARWRGSRSADIALRLSDGRFESPGEARSQVLFFEFGIDRPEPQFLIVDREGVVIARTDFTWLRHRHVGEFDGRGKYRLWTPGQDPTTRVVEEKVREDDVRAEGFGVTRWGSAGLDGPPRKVTAAKIQRGLDRSLTLYGGLGPIVRRPPAPASLG